MENTIMESIFETKEQYLEFIKNWKEACNNEDGYKLEFEHFILYRMFKGKDWNKCIAESSKDETKDNGLYIATEKKYKYLSLWPFGNTITEEMLDKARDI